MKKFLAVLLGFAVLLWLAGLIYFDYTINHFEVDHTTKTDAIVVLTGGRHRLEEAVKLLNDGVSDKLFISGVEKNISLKEIKKRHDIDITTNGEITLDKVATNTFENARETSNWIDKEKLHSIRLVTSNYHLWRSLVEFRRWNKEIKIVLHPVFSERISTAWWKSLDSFCFLAAEYNKFLFATVRAFICRV